MQGKGKLLSHICIIALLFWMQVTMADEALLSVLNGNKTEKSVDTPSDPEVLKALATPQKTVETFLAAMEGVKEGDGEQLKQAILTMDMSGVNPIVQQEKAEAWAWQLIEIIHAILPDSNRLPPSKTDADHWVLAKLNEHSVSLIKQEKNLNDTIEVRWLFSHETLQNLGVMLETLEELHPEQSVNLTQKPFNLTVIDRIPKSLKGEVLGLKTWQWIGIFIFVLLGLVADLVFKGVSQISMRRLIKHSHSLAYKDLPEDMLRPFGLMIMAMIWWIGVKNLLFPEWALLILIVAVKFLISVSGVWGAYRLVDLVGASFRHKAGLTANKFDDALVPLIRRTLKVFVTVIGLIFIADTLQINIAGLLAGLGLGGLAFALASKDLAQNLLGTVTILVERTFSVGDWVVIGDVEGTVEDISFRSTRIRTFYNSLITLPNSNMITAPVDNYGERRFRRFSSKLGLAYATPPDKIEAFCEGVREIVRLHPYMRKDSYHVYFNGYADSALEILVYVFWETPDWATELRERHRFLLDVLRLSRALGVDFAYPTQTVYWKEIDENGNPVSEKQTQSEAFDAARKTARDIVESTLGINEKPEPVTIERRPLSR